MRTELFLAENHPMLSRQDWLCPPVSLKPFTPAAHVQKQQPPVTTLAIFALDNSRPITQSISSTPVFAVELGTRHGSIEEQSEYSALIYRRRIYADQRTATDTAMASLETSQVDGDRTQGQSVSSPSPSPSEPLSSSASHTSPAKVPSDIALRTPERSRSQIGNTAGAGHRGCSSEKESFKMVKVHTAKCSECDQRNMDTMLRCPGCTFQVCRPCRDKRDCKGKGLAHGVMASPGGLFRAVGLLDRSGGLGTGGGSVTRKRLAGMNGSMSPSPAPTFRLGLKVRTQDVDVGGAEDDSEALENGNKVESKFAPTRVAKSASKKRTAKSHPKSVSDEESSGDDFRLESMSPTQNKRRRTALNLTDTPTATSARPSRRVSGPGAYVITSSPSSDGTLEVNSSGVHQVLPHYIDVSKAVDTNKEGPLAPTDRIQELLEQHGVNTPVNPYDEHFLGRRVPVVINPIIRMPPSIGGKEASKK